MSESPVNDDAVPIDSIVPYNNQPEDYNDVKNLDTKNQNSDD